MIARSRPRTADIRRDRRPELQEPAPDRLVGCFNTSLGQQFLDIPKGQCEPGIEPDRVADDFWREVVALKRYRSHPMMLIGDQPQSHPSYRDIALGASPACLSEVPSRFMWGPCLRHQHLCPLLWNSESRTMRCKFTGLLRETGNILRGRTPFQTPLLDLVA